MNGPFGNMFPYSNFHSLNLDWIIQVAKDFLDKYSEIQQTIDSGIEELDAKAAELQGLLDAWYTDHSDDIANQLADALEDISEALETATTDFNTRAETKALETIATIPDDYTALSNHVLAIDADLTNVKRGLVTDQFSVYATWTKGYLKADGTIQVADDYYTSSLIYVPAGYICVFNSYASGSTFFYQIFDSLGQFDETGLAGISSLVPIHTTRYEDHDTWIKITTKIATVPVDDVEPFLTSFVKRDVSSFIDNKTITIYPELFNGYFNLNDGVTVDDHYINTGIIKVPKGYLLHANINNSSSTYAYKEYNSDGTLLRDGITGGLNGTINIPAAFADRYIALCSKDKFTFNDLGIELRQIDYSSEYNTTNMSSNMGTSIAAQMSYGNGYISSSTGATQGSDNYTYSSMIPLAKGQTIELNACGSASVFLMNEINRDYTSIRGIFTGNSGFNRIKYTADHDMLIRICTRHDNLSHTPFVPSQDFISGWKIYYDTQDKINKSAVVIGDSLIYGNRCKENATWCKMLENDTGMTVYNYGINGSSIANVDDRNPMCIRYETIEELPTADLVILEGGANDFNTDVPLGDMSSSNSTFKGALTEIINGIRDINPQAKIMFMTTYHRNNNTNTEGLKYRDYADAMIEVCEALSVPCFNNYTDSGLLFPDTNMGWQDEGIYLGESQNNHISPEGYEFIYPTYKNWILNNIR